jgi:integrase
MTGTRHHDARPVAMTLGEWLDEWSAPDGPGHTSERAGRYGAGLSVSAKRREEWQIRALRDGLGDVLLMSLTRQRIDGWLKQRAVTPYERVAWGRATCEGVRRFLALVLEQPVADGYAISPNQAGEAKTPGTARPPVKRTSLSMEDAQRLQSAATFDSRPVAQVIALMLATGMRPGEARTLRWAQVDLESTPPTATVVDAKTDTGNRVVQLPATAAAVLRGRARTAELAVRDPEAYVFPGESAPCVSADHLIDEVVRMCERLGITVGKGKVAPRTPKPHELRHTVGSVLLAKGMDPLQVAALLGHNPETLYRVYHHELKAEVGGAAIPLLDDLYGEKGGRAS